MSNPTRYVETFTIQLEGTGGSVFGDWSTTKISWNCYR